MAIELQKKEASEFNEATIKLFKVIEKEDSKVKDFLLANYNGLPVSPEAEERAFDYFVSQSVITAAGVANPGSSMITEFLYDGLSSPSPIDGYILQSTAGSAIKARLIAIQEKLPEIIRERLNRNKGKVLIGNLGSGPGRDIINTLGHHFRNTSDVRAIHLDKDSKALDRGKRIAKIKGVDHLIEFVETDFLRYRPSAKFDIILLVGVLCPLETEKCITYLKRVKGLLKEDGCLIASNASKKMLSEDPFTCYLMGWAANWRLVYKDEREVRQIFEKAGYNWKGCFLDFYGFHIMGMGIPTQT